MHQSKLTNDDTLKIGAVSRLTGVSTHTLRKWESRYGAVTPARSEGGERTYSREDVERLRLIKHLVDAGVAPRDVASLTQDELAQKSEHLAAVEKASLVEDKRPVRVAVIGSSVSAMLDRNAAQTGLLEIVASADTPSNLAQAQAGTDIDVLVYECANLHADTRATVDALRDRLGAPCAIVVYRFTARGDLLSLQSPELATLRAPVDLRALEQVAVALARSGTAARPVKDSVAHAASRTDDVPAPRFSRDVIARIARSSPKLRCECPHHLSEVLLVLRAFEEYSAACESENPEDATLHHYLWRCAAQSRALFEEAIERVAAVEGISLEER